MIYPHRNTLLIGVSILACLPQEASSLTSIATSTTTRTRATTTQLLRIPRPIIANTSRDYTQRYPRDTTTTTLRTIAIEDLHESRASRSFPRAFPRDLSTTTVLPSPPRSTSTTSNSNNILSYIIPNQALVPEVAAEAFGTFLLLQLALGCVLSVNFAGRVLPVAALTGVAITGACSAVSHRCAAHFNPVITLTMCLYRQFGWRKFVPYCMAQLIGATSAALVNYGLYASKIAQWEATNGVVRSSLQGGFQTAKTMGCYSATPLAGFAAEAVGTFALTAVVFALTSKRNPNKVDEKYVPALIGATVTGLIGLLGPISAASFNPARELGPRLIMKLFGWSSTVAFSQLGVYVAAALVGATAGGWFVDHVLFPKQQEMEEQGPILLASSFE